MPKKILIISGSPKKDGNTQTLIEWFIEGLGSEGNEIEIVRAATLKQKTFGCISCRVCQKSEKYECAVDDDVKKVFIKMSQADMIVMATPLYFFGPSAQLKSIFDRMFSLYKWDNEAGTMKTVLKGKMLVLIASAFEDIGLDALEKPFQLTAEYTGMPFKSLLIPNAGVSGDIKMKLDIRNKTIEFGRRLDQD